MIARLKNLLKSGQAIEFDDSGDIQTSKSSWLGRTRQTVESLVPYGTFGTPMSKVRQIFLSLRGNESNISAFNSDSTNRIKKDTKPGEYGIGSPLTGANIYFKANGDAVVEIPSGKFIIGADSIELNGNTKSFVTYTELNIALQTMLTTINANFGTKLDGAGTPGVNTLDISGSETQTVKTGG